MRDDAYDCLVLGGGPAGLTASLQAARAGARTILVEKQAQLGGTITAGGITAIQSFGAYEVPIIAGIGMELVVGSFAALGRNPEVGRRYRERDGVTAYVVDPAVFAAVTDAAVLETGIELRLHTLLGDLAPTADGGWRVTLCGKEGLYEVAARVIVDCSGDANAVQRAGLPVLRPDERQPGTLVVRLEGYDVDVLDLPAIQAAFDAAVERGEMRASDVGWHGGKVERLLRGRGGNCIQVVSGEADDSPGRTAMEVEARATVLRLLGFLRAQPGLEDLRVAWSAAECGVRETVQIAGRRTVTVEDYLSGRRFADAVSFSFYPIDIHLPTGIHGRPLERGVIPTIPFGALLPVEGRNLLVAGRCAAGDREAFSAFRVEASCMAMGQAAGAAAALAVERVTDIAEVPVPVIRELLAAHGAIVPGVHEPTEADGTT